MTLKIKKFHFTLFRETKAIKNKWKWQYYYDGDIIAESDKCVLSTSLNEIIRRLQKRADLYNSEIYPDMKEGGYYGWRLKANNGQIVARSVLRYPNRGACRKALNKFRDTVPKASWVKIFKDKRGKKEKYS